MALRIVTADERLSHAANKSTIVLFGPTGAGKTTQLKHLPERETVCIDLEAGLKSVQDWRGDSLPIRAFDDAVAVACLIGGVNPAAAPNEFYSEFHYQHLCTKHTELARLLAGKSVIFLDSLTDLTRQAMAWAKTRPEAFSEKTGKPDTRGAYGLMAREVIGLLKHLQHAPGKTVIFVGVLEKITDEFNVTNWQPQLEGSKAGRELPGIVDQVMSLHLFSRDAEGGYVLDDKATDRRLVCRAGNPYGLPAKDRSGRLDLTEAPHLGSLLAKINTPTTNPTPVASAQAA